MKLLATRSLVCIALLTALTACAPDNDKTQSDKAQNNGAEPGTAVDGQMTTEMDSMSLDKNPSSALAMTGTTEAKSTGGGLIITQIIHSGNGCPAGTVPQADISPDGKAFTVLFAQFGLEFNPAPKAKRNLRKSCQLTLTVQQPRGYQFAVLGIDTRGFAQLGARDHAHVESHVAFAGQIFPMVRRTTLAGPFNDDYGPVHHEFGLRSAVWSACQRVTKLNLKLELGLDVSGANAAQATVDSLDGEIKNNYVIATRPCH